MSTVGGGQKLSAKENELLVDYQARIMKRKNVKTLALNAPPPKATEQYLTQPANSQVSQHGLIDRSTAHPKQMTRLQDPAHIAPLLEFAPPTVLATTISAALDGTQPHGIDSAVAIKSVDALYRYGSGSQALGDGTPLDYESEDTAAYIGLYDVSLG